jgi:nitroimidazol reductase NimA-like FMN-containing flavoprotein (pyridoxamine 5'-phosphate oxidase superfamily)
MSMPGGSEIYEELSLRECLELLGAHDFGRIAVVVDGQPIALPVNYSLDGDAVVFRTDPGTKLRGAAMGRVAFEIDGTDEVAQVGWSVIVQGVGNDITDALDHRSEQLRLLETRPWIPGDQARWVEILPDSVTGRRLSRPWRSKGAQDADSAIAAI